VKTIIISPYAAKLRNGKRNAKNYPYWSEMISIFKNKNYYVIQLGVEGEDRLTGVDEFRQNLSYDDIESLLKKEDTLAMSVDSLLPHFCKTINVRCIVLWGRSDPSVFGYPENINFLKDRKYLRNKHDQWVFWEDVPYDPEPFMTAESVVSDLIMTRII